MENNFQINGFEYVENALQLDNEMLYPSQLNDIFGMLTGKIRKYSLSHAHVKCTTRMYHDCWVNESCVFNHDSLKITKTRNRPVKVMAMRSHILLVKAICMSVITWNLQQ